MKTFISLLLGALISSTSLSNLNSQVEKNQVTGDRLQVTGAKMAELPSDLSFQIVGLTTNCDNSDENLSCHLMMDPVSAEEVGKLLQEKALSKEAPSEVQKPVDAFHEAVARKAARADEDIIRIKTAQERVEEAAAARTGFVERIKNDAKNRSAFIEELQKIWTSDIISTSSEVVIKLVADTRYEALKADLIAIEAKTEAHEMN
ncbi:MAG TPA: hypothetical protein VJK54_08920, partial [Chthoniobacterales bacterium]|nr:hypothetical protein [Chthoniobacterales bacterium]